MIEVAYGLSSLLNDRIAVTLILVPSAYIFGATEASCPNPILDDADGWKHDSLDGCSPYGSFPSIWLLFRAWTVGGSTRSRYKPTEPAACLTARKGAASQAHDNPVLRVETYRNETRYDQTRSIGRCNATYHNETPGHSTHRHHVRGEQANNHERDS